MIQGTIKRRILETSPFRDFKSILPIPLYFEKKSEEAFCTFYPSLLLPPSPLVCLSVPVTVSL